MSYPKLPVRTVLAVALLICCASGVFAADTETLSRGLFTVSFDGGQRRVAEYSLDILEAAVAEFDAFLPVGEQPITVLVIAAPDEFDRYAVHFAGLDIAGLARPGDDLIVVKAPRLRMPGSDYPGTLRHELVHLLLHRNVNPAYVNSGDIILNYAR